tara:strand:- start:1199 stop:2134 length:936 start_codon:yes stop_codon:yes gene_type:complete
MNIIVIISSLVLASFSFIFIQKHFISMKRFVAINNRSSHTSIATNSGGISIFLTIFLISCILYILGIEIYDYKILVPLSIMSLIGFYDDVYDIDFKLKLIFQIITAKIIIDQGYIISNLHGVFGIYELSSLLAQPLTIFIIISIINAINFIDGLDGLALSVISVFIISFEFFGKNFFYFDNLSLLIILCMTPLWYFNFKKNKKIFLGDSGSLMFGTLISIYTISILTNEYVIKEEYDVHKVLFVISILFYPIIDIIRIFFIRIINRKSPFVADKKHIHHLLLRSLKFHWAVNLIIVITTIVVILLIQLLFN